MLYRLLSPVACKVDNKAFQGTFLGTYGWWVKTYFDVPKSLTGYDLHPRDLVRHVGSWNLGSRQHYVLLRGQRINKE